jgi:putative sigma-54 modulation protein
MQILINSVHFKAGPDLEEFTRDTLERLGKLNGRIVRAHVTLSQEPGTDPNNKSCEILLSLPGEDPFLKKTGATFEEAIALATNAMEKVLRRMKPR